MAQNTDDDPQAVVVTDPEPADAPPLGAKRRRTTTADILRAIREIPDAVAAKVEGAPAPGASASPRSVTFEAEPEPEPEDDEPDDEPKPGPAPTPEWQPRFRHPSRGRRRVEIGT
jgi:hypothetical protein